MTPPGKTFIHPNLLRCVNHGGNQDAVDRWFEKIREKRRNQESPSTRLKKSMKRSREKERAVERFEIRMLKGQQ